MPHLPRYFPQITEPYRGKNDQMQVIGLCRFSYPALGGFQREHETSEQRKTFLYDAARLKHRLRLFQAFNLPSILAQTDMDFQYPIRVGDDLPVWARNRLDDLTAAADHIKILPYPPHPHRQIAAQVILDHVDATHTHSIQFRLDDDDAVHRTFVERLKTDAATGVLIMQTNHALPSTTHATMRSGRRPKDYRPRNWCEIYGPPHWQRCSKHRPRIRS